MRIFFMIALILCSSVCLALDGKTISLPDLRDGVIGDSPTELLTRKLETYGFVVKDTVAHKTVSYLLPEEPGCTVMDAEQINRARNKTLTLVEATVRSNWDYYSWAGEWKCVAEVIGSFAFKGDINCSPTSEAGDFYIVPGTSAGKFYTYCHLRPDN